MVSHPTSFKTRTKKQRSAEGGKKNKKPHNKPALNDRLKSTGLTSCCGQSLCASSERVYDIFVEPVATETSPLLSVNQSGTHCGHYVRTSRFLFFTV